MARNNSCGVDPETGDEATTLASTTEQSTVDSQLGPRKTWTPQVGSGRGVGQQGAVIAAGA
jgi:hypothetical protein